MNPHDKVDYTTNGFTVFFENQDSKYYASVHAQQFRSEDGLDFDGTYFVYLLHPTMGSTTFTLEPEELVAGKWITRDAPSWIDHLIIEPITSKIAEFRTIS